MPLPAADRLCILRFAASFLWADLSIELAEQAFFVALAHELGVPDAALPAVVEMLARPPEAEQVDPTRVSPRLARAVREVALRAIASDGRVLSEEMDLFDLLDELLPPSKAPPARVRSRRGVDAPVPAAPVSLRTA